MHTVKSLRFILLIVLLIAAISPAQAQDDANVVVIPAGETIKIALVTDLTGPIAPMGLDILQAGEIAVMDFNAAGGVEGFQVELVVEDDGCAGDQATTVASKIVANEQIVAVAGHSCSGATTAASDIYEEARLPMMSPSATATVLATRGLDVFNRVAPVDKDQAATDAAFMFKVLGHQKLAILHDNDTYGLGLAEATQAAWEALGGEVVAFQGITPGDQDYRAVLTALVPKEPDAIFFGGYQQEAVLLVPQMHDVGLGDVTFVSDDGIFAQAFIDGAGEYAEGVYASFPTLAVGPAERNAEFDAVYEELYGVLPHQQGPFHAQSYDATMILMLAVQKVAVLDDAGNLVIDREALIEAVRNTADYDGLTGMLTCDEIGNCGTSLFGVYVVEDAEWVELELPGDLLDM